MGKIVLTIMMILLSSSLYGKCVLFNDKKGDHYQMYSNVFLEDFDISKAKRTEIFFGKKSEYLDNLNSGFKNVASSSLVTASNAISSQAGNIAKGLFKSVGQNVAGGLATGLVIGAIDYYKKESLKPVEYYYVVEFKNSKNETTRGIVYFESFSNKYKEMENPSQIKQIMKEGF